ncbi:MAG: aldose 1-epimerase [Alphaproteobacteria bacterium]|nr:MAG: aldose 1-epimerase [Alphaproteobacteria bacterium]
MARFSMTNDSLPTLSCGPLLLVLAPSLGGSIASLTYVTEDKREIPVLHGSEGFPSHVLMAGSFPLVPFANRVRGGRFSFRGREVTLAPNLAGEASPLHGQVWVQAWEVVSVGVDEAELRFRHAAGEWPWDYEARQLFRVEEGAVSVTLSCRNVGGEPMPCGLGHHPYFPCDADTRIDAEVEHAWTIDDATLPLEKVWAEGRYALRERLICGQGLDNGFWGWDGGFTIAAPGLRIRVTSPEARFLHVYSPGEGERFAAEPVTHANAALNEAEGSWPDLGLRVLEPGEEMAVTMRIEVEAQ